MEQKGNIVIFAVIGVVILVAGFFVGQMVQKSADKKVQDQMAKEIFATTGAGMMSGSFSGKIAGISSDKNSVTVEVSSPFPGVNLPQAYKTKTVLMVGDTKIFSQSQKDPMEFSREMADFSVKMRNAGVPKPGVPSQMIIPPTPFVQKEIKVSDLKIGDQISFSFTQKEGLSVLDSQFTATQIYVNNPQPVSQPATSTKQ